MTEILTPSNLDEAEDAIRQSATGGHSLQPCGNRTRIHRHDPDAAPSRWLSLSSLDSILDIQPGDHTCTVQPGVSAAKLDDAMAPHGLELGILSPGGEDGTLGGLFLAPDLSLLRRRHGPPRDQVLGGKWILSDGTRVSTGSKVVKSVAGYDVTRLFLGSRGRLATCVELTLRLRQRPRELRAFRLGDPSTPAGLALGKARVSAFVRDSASTNDPIQGWALFEGAPPPGFEGQEVDLDEARRGLGSALGAFSSSSVRMHLPPGSDLPEHCPWTAWDPLGGQLALATFPDSPPSGCHILPVRESSPWLAPLAEACAPGAPPFGGEAP